MELVSSGTLTHLCRHIQSETVPAILTLPAPLWEQEDQPDANGRSWRRMLFLQTCPFTLSAAMRTWWSLPAEPCCLVILGNVRNVSKPQYLHLYNEMGESTIPQVLSDLKFPYFTSSSDYYKHRLIGQDELKSKASS